MKVLEGLLAKRSSCIVVRKNTVQRTLSIEWNG